MSRANRLPNVVLGRPCHRKWTLLAGSFRYLEPMTKLTDSEARKIEEGIESGLRGPILLTWIRRLLEDRRERIAEARAMTLAKPPPAPGVAKKVEN